MRMEEGEFSPNPSVIMWKEKIPKAWSRSGHSERQRGQEAQTLVGDLVVRERKDDTF